MRVKKHLRRTQGKYNRHLHLPSSIQIQPPDQGDRQTKDQEII